MKTDYFTTFLDTLNNRSTAFTAAAPVRAAAAPAAGSGAGPLDLNLILKALADRDTVPLPDLVQSTGATPGTLITALQQLSAFGLVHYDPAGVRLTEQGQHVAASVP